MGRKGVYGKGNVMGGKERKDVSVGRRRKKR